MWRPNNWEKLKIDLTIELLKRIKPRRKPRGEEFVEAGADAVLEALRVGGVYRKAVVDEHSPNTPIRKGWIVFIPDEEENNNSL